MMRRSRVRPAAFFLPLLIGLFVAFSFVFGPVLAATTDTISFQSKLVNADGTNISDNTYNFRFRLYNAASGGTLLWSEDRSLAVSDGVVSADLGAVTAFSTVPTLFDNADLYLQICFDANGSTGDSSDTNCDSVSHRYEEVFSTRKAITAVPLAFRAKALTDGAGNSFGPNSFFKQGGNAFGAAGVLGTTDANSLQFKTNNSVAVTILSGGDVGIGTSTPGRALEVADSTDPQLRLSQTTGSVYADLQVNSSGDLAFLTGGSSRMSIASTGGVDIANNLAVGGGASISSISIVNVLDTFNSASTISGVKAIVSNTGDGDVIGVWGASTGGTAFGTVAYGGYFVGNAADYVGTSIGAYAQAYEGDRAIGVFVESRSSTPGSAISGGQFSADDMSSASTVMGLEVSATSSNAGTSVYGLYISASNSAYPTNEYAIYTFGDAKSKFGGNVVIDAALAIQEASSGGNYTYFQGGVQAADITYTLPTSSTNGVLTNTGGVLSWAAGGGAGDITDVGSMTSGAAFADATADDDWLGLGASAGRIEFDDQTVDEINFLSSYVGIGTSTPGSELDVKGILRLSGATSGFVGFAPAASAGSTVYTLPAADGSSNQVLTTDGGGVLSWGSLAGPAPAHSSTIGFGINNVPAAATTALSLFGASNGNYDWSYNTPSTTVTLPGPGSIVAIRMNTGAAITAGTATCQPTINGSPVSFTAQLGAGNLTNYVIENPGVYTFSSSDVLGAQIVSASLSPTTNEMSCSITISYDGTGTNQWTTNSYGIYYTAGSVGIGTTAPSRQLTVSNASNASYIGLERVKAAAIANLDILGAQEFTGIDPSAGTVNAALIIARASSAWSSTSAETDLAFFTTPSGGLTRALRFTIEGSGRLLMSVAPTTANTTALCWDNSGSSYINDCNGSATDIAEYYKSVPDVEPGDVVAHDSTTYLLVRKTEGENDQNVAGIISTNPSGPLGDVMGEGTIEEKDNPVPLALVGRVPTKVNLEGGAIAIGDMLTLASVPGVAKKYTGTGIIIGRALEAYDGTTQLSPGVEYIHQTLIDKVKDQYQSELESEEMTQQEVDALTAPQIAEMLPPPPALGVGKIMVNVGIDQNAGVSTLSGMDSSFWIGASESTISTPYAITASGVTSTMGEFNVMRTRTLTVNDLFLVDDVGNLTTSGTVTAAMLATPVIKGVGGQVDIALGVDELFKVTANGASVIEASVQGVKVNNLVVTDQQAGKAVIKAGSTEITVKSNLVTGSSVVVGTPNKAVVVSVVQGVGEFTIKLSAAASEDVEVGWYVVNVE